MKRVFKYGTGQVIPIGAVYLCTKTETIIKKVKDSEGEFVTFKKNIYVWHYFLVEAEDNE